MWLVPQVGGQTILPGAAMLEMAATAGSALVDDSQTRGRAALSSVAIAAPVTLPAAHSARVAQLVLHTDGSFRLVTAAAKGSLESRHCWGKYGKPAATTVGSPQCAEHPFWLRLGAAVQPPAPRVAATVTAGPEHASGYLMHPTILDATLHLSAAAAPPTATQAHPCPQQPGRPVRACASAAGAAHPMCDPTARRRRRIRHLLLPAVQPGGERGSAAKWPSS